MPTNKKHVTQNEQLMDRVKELEETIATLQSAPAAGPSNSRVQAEAALALLKSGTVTVEQLKAINPKYPSDPIYFVRTVLKQPVVTHRSKEGKTIYSLPDQKPETMPATA